MAYRHCNTQAFVEDQIKFVNALFGSNVLDVSYYAYRKLYEPSSLITFHYFCPACDVPVGSSKDFSRQKNVKFKKCPKCGQDIDVHSFDSGNYFVTISLREQFESILSFPGIKFIQREGRDPDLIKDMCDGEISKSCMQPGGPFFDKKYFTVTFNTDGVRVFKSSSTNSMWPFFMHINEICPEQRLAVSNLMLGGLWFGKSSPNMSLFMKPILEDLKSLSVDGVNFQEPDGSIVKYRVYGIAGSFDSVAKCKCVCQKQFNGKIGCLYCLHPNDTVAPEDVNKEKSSGPPQTYYDTSVTYPVRTETDVIRDMYRADQLQRQNQLKTNSVNGFLGLFYSLLLLSTLSYFRVLLSSVLSGASLLIICTQFWKALQKIC